MDDRLKRQMEFALEIDKEKNVFRQTHLSGNGRNENDAEHTWHMAIMAYLLKEYSNEPVDISRVIIMCLIHDIVEIDAGDTYAYDSEGLTTQKAREDAAKERIFSLLPEDQKAELIALFQKTLDLTSVESVIIHKSNSTRENRYSIMIEMNLSPEGLENFDASDVHKEWKAIYGDRLESKAIFDCD